MRLPSARQVFGETFKQDDGNEEMEKDSIVLPVYCLLYIENYMFLTCRVYLRIIEVDL